MRYLYTILFYLALPFILGRLYWRSLKLPAYRQRVCERFGFYPISFDQCIWVHTVSVGEVIAAIPLIKALQKEVKHLPILMTTTTPTGAERIKAALGESVTHAYLPYDLPDAIARFLNKMHPTIAIIMETELWPNLLAGCHQRHIPVCLLNARLSEKSARGYQRIASLTREMLNHLAVIAAQGHEDAKRFVALGADSANVIVTGNIKFDLQCPPDLATKSKVLRHELGQERFIWVAASTHEGEEEILLTVQQQLKLADPQALLILVPRHPDRFDAVAKLIEQKNLKMNRRSQTKEIAEGDVYLCDTMGELLLMYAVSDVAFVGGSLIPRGGHNMLEPGVLGKAILTGPHLFNFAEISKLFVTANAMIIVDNADTLMTQLMLLKTKADERKQMGDRAFQVVAANRGALQKQLEIILKIQNSHS